MAEEKKGTGTEGADGGKPTVRPFDRVKGATQMAVGTAVAAAGVPMLVLPGPGAAAVVGGAALASRGQRTFTGREATRVEAALDEVSARAGEAVAAQAKRVVKAVPGVALGAVVAGGRLALAGGRAAARLAASTRAGGHGTVEVTVEQVETVDPEPAAPAAGDKE